MDMWLLSRCKTLFYQGNSSFSEFLIYYIQIKMIVMIGKKFENLCFFTSSFPYGYGETFIESEINYLAQSFNNIYLFPLHINDNLRNLPDNVEIVFLKPVTKKKENLQLNTKWVLYT